MLTVLALLSATPDAHAIDVFHCYSASDLYKDDVAAKLSSDPRVDSVTDFDCGDATPSLDDLAGHDAVLFYSDGSFNSPSALGDVLADWVDGGGGAVEAVFSVADNLRVDGRFYSDGYRAMTSDRQTNCSDGLDALIPDHPILDGVGSFDGGSSGYCAGEAAPAIGAVHVATWGSGQSLVAEHVPSGAGAVVALNFYPPSSDARDDFWTSSTDGDLLLVNALEFVADGGGPTFTVVGSCPGAMGFDIGGATPRGRVAILSAATTGSQVIPGGPCAGAVSGLSTAGFALRSVLTADADGNVTMAPMIPDGACGAAVQALDLDTCTFTNVPRL